jgi:cytochrome c peroxidase
MAKPCLRSGWMCPLLLLAGVASMLPGCERTPGVDRSELTAPADRGDAFPPALPASEAAADETFEQMMARLVAEKPAFMRRQLELLQARYDLSDQPSATVRMTRGRPIQVGVRVRVPDGYSWEDLQSLSPQEIKELDVFPAGFFPLPHVKHAEGGMVFPHFAIEEILAQTGRDLQRFDLEFDLPDHFLPEFPPAIFLTTRPDLGDVSRGEILTTQNFFRLFKDKLNPKQLNGLRLLVFPFAQQQFNLTDDRRSTEPSLGVGCFDCHVNGHTDAAFHLVGDIRPQAFRNRIETVSLRGVNIQRLFGSQRALMSVEDFTEFEQRAAYFDGDPARAELKGVNILDRGDQVHHMGEVQKLFDFPPAPKLDVFGRLHPSASAAERRGERLFYGKARCAECHPPPYFTDNSMHDLMLDRFFTPREINGMHADGDGPIKTFVLRGIKESPPYLHDGRLLTLDDTVEFFDLVLELHLSKQEKRDLLAFLLVL